MFNTPFKLVLCRDLAIVYPHTISLISKRITGNNVGKFRKYSSLIWKHIASILKASYDRKRGYLMFLDNLSASLLQICDAEHLSYERAAERCDCSSKHFSNIVCRRSCPSLKVFEQICIGFQKSPNRLLGVEQDELSFRSPMPVVEIRIFSSVSGSPAFPVCPRCKCILEREYMSYCNNCGQCLSWKNFKDASIEVRT